LQPSEPKALTFINIRDILVLLLGGYKYRESYLLLIAMKVRSTGLGKTLMVADFSRFEPTRIEPATLEEDTGQPKRREINE